MTIVRPQLQYSIQQGGVMQNFFRFSKTGTMLPIKYSILFCPIQKNLRIWPLACAAKFSLSKNHRDLKMNLFYFICKYLPFTLKNKRQKKIRNLFFSLNLCFGPQNAQICFSTWPQEKLVSFYFQLSNKLRNTFCFRQNL